MSERDLLLAQALTALDESRKDTAALAQSLQSTLDRIVTARYDRPAPPPRPVARERSPMDAALRDDDTPGGPVQ